jgi:carbonic anhydrase
MLADHTQLASKQYKVEPVPKDLIASTGEKKANILWVGCSDSWITETSALDVLPEETFVHRNLGNVMSNGDLSSQSAISYSIDFLRVRTIALCDGGEHRGTG